MKIRNTKWRRLSAAAVLLAGAQAALLHADGDRAVGHFPGLSPGMQADLGGQIGLQNIIDNFYEIVAGDNRLNTVLTNRQSGALQEAQKKALLQTLMGTPTVAAGTTHSGIVQLSDTQYNAIVEDLYEAFDRARVSYHTSNRVLGTLVAYEPLLVSAYLNAKPAVESGEVIVGPIESK